MSSVWEVKANSSAVPSLRLLFPESTDCQSGFSFKQKDSAMKTAADPRHRLRVRMMQALFALSFTGGKKGKENVSRILKLLPQIDTIISQAAPERPVDKIAKIDLSILRLAVFELTVEKKEPPKVIIDEAVELAKAYGGEGSAPFINGALGNIYSLITHEH